MKCPLISIIMAAHNAENTIRQAIDSVLVQTFHDFELIVVDDCSSDGTRKIAEAYSQSDSRIRLITNETNKGVSATRLTALKASRGEWIAVLDSDDAWLPEKLEKQIALQKQTGASLLYCASQFMEHNGKRLNWVMQVPEKVSYRQLLKQNILSNSSSLCRKELFEKYYVTGDQMHEDFALWLGILKSGQTAYGVNEPLLIYRLSKNSKSSNKLKAALMNWRTYRKTGLNVFEALYYEAWYIVKSILKYSNLSE